MSEREGSSPASNLGGDNASLDPDSTDGLGPEEDSDEFVVRALERAQRVARNLGYTRSTLPSWGLDETRPRRSLDGSSEYAAIETDGLGRLAADDADGAQARAAARAAAYGHANGVPAPASSTDEDPEGDLAALRQALEATGASWSAIVGPQVAEHARIETFEGHKLVVRTDSTAWAKQLQLLLPTIERRIAEEVGSGVVEQLVILGPVAPSWKKGPYVVRGRGPRADYG